METKNFYNEILTEHNMHPEFKHDLSDADIVLDGVNPSCGDEIQLKLKTDGDTIVDGAFVGGWVRHFPGLHRHHAWDDRGKEERGSLKAGKSVHADDPGRGHGRGD